MTGHTLNPMPSEYMGLECTFLPDGIHVYTMLLRDTNHAGIAALQHTPNVDMSYREHASFTAEFQALVGENNMPMLFGQHVISL